MEENTHFFVFGCCYDGTFLAEHFFQKDEQRQLFVNGNMTDIHNKTFIVGPSSAGLQTGGWGSETTCWSDSECSFHLAQFITNLLFAQSFYDFLLATGEGGEFVVKFPCWFIDFLHVCTVPGLSGIRPCPGTSLSRTRNALDTFPWAGCCNLPKDLITSANSLSEYSS